MTTKTSLGVIGDFVIHLESSEYCTIGAFVKNPAGGTATIANPIGYPVKLVTTDWTLVLATDEANATAFIIKGDPFVALAAATNSPTKYQILKHPPAILCSDKIATTDARGAAFTVATLVTAFKALGFEFRTNPAKTTTQST